MKKLGAFICQGVVLCALLAAMAGCAPLQTQLPPPTSIPATVTLPATAEASPTPQMPTAAPTSPPTAAITPTVITPFSFAVTADMRAFTGPGEYDTPAYFRGALEAIAALGNAAFLVTPGDIDNPWNSRWSIDQALGANFPWFAGVGNHEHLEESMAWLRLYNPDTNGDTPPNITNPGPKSCPQTTYSFDYQNAHFVMLNIYCDALKDMTTYGTVGGTLYNWLEADLAAAQKEHIFVFGHEPAFPLPDADTGRVRHLGASLDKEPADRDRFWALLRERGVTAYICGHTHNYSAARLDGVWQIDVGHARGVGDPEVPSTFVVFRVDGASVVYETYRAGENGQDYTLHDWSALSP